MLNEFWVDLKLKGEDSNRSLNTILRIADAHAGLALKEVIDVKLQKMTRRRVGARDQWENTGGF